MAFWIGKQPIQKSSSYPEQNVLSRTRITGGLYKGTTGQNRYTARTQHQG